jgi:adenylyltransferase/sulfurtransferase
MVEEISVIELKSRLDASTQPVVVDVREPWELAIAKLAGTVNIPMNEIPDRLGDIPRNADVIVMCRSGARSLRVANYLLQNGYASVANLRGGILAWSELVDPDLPQY